VYVRRSTHTYIYIYTHCIEINLSTQFSHPTWYQPNRNPSPPLPSPLSVQVQAVPPPLSGQLQQLASTQCATSDPSIRICTHPAPSRGFVCAIMIPRQSSRSILFGGFLPLQTCLRSSSVPLLPPAQITTTPTRSTYPPGFIVVD
jgi:hypothetical protein